ncbi:MAG: sigma-54 dependent transcriptional regulator [Nitrospiraceae bacterium]|nr:sigma-54 dependent transcriptional regulator [Nitrospiraceae bacterium]
MAAYSKGRILVVDDEVNAVRVLSAIFSDEGYEVVTSTDVERASKVVNDDDIDVVITDYKMPGRDGMRLFEYICEIKPDIPVVFLTAYGTIESAVDAMTRGAFYYFLKPHDYSKLKGIVARAVEQRRLKREIDLLKNRLNEGNGSYRIIGSTPAFHKTLETLEAVKDSASNVLVSGETGTGKELVARALHYRSLRSSRAFVTVNCAAIPKELIEVELFGCEKGAFTGAVSRRTGKFEEAANGVIFLDEISELELSMQAKLLRVLQEREIERIGSNRKIKVEFRLISATNRDLAEEVKKGRFREDLYYRINVIEIKVPPLRERKDDIPLLAAAFLGECCAKQGKMVALSAEVAKILHHYAWPGNVRQLRNVIERAVVLAKGKQIGIRELSEEVLPSRKPDRSPDSPKTLKELEIQAIREALHACRGNKSKTAKMLGISRKAFYRRLREAGQGSLFSDMSQ